MDYVICIYEESHGLIGIAADYLAAIDFLIKEQWLDNDTEITDEEIPVGEKFGEKWVEAIESLEPKKFNDIFFERFYLEEEKIYHKYQE